VRIKREEKIEEKGRGPSEVKRRAKLGFKKEVKI
jgi:hypothetical protein